MSFRYFHQGWRIRLSISPWPKFRLKCRNFHCSSVHAAKLKLSFAESSRLLDLPVDPTLKQLRNRYIDLAKVYHPDSRSPKADTVKFAELRKAYKVVYDRIKSQEEEEEYESDDDIEEEMVSDHIAPQHRNYLNYGGFGCGPPSQREKAYQKHRAVKAYQRASEHQLTRSTESSDDVSALTVRVKKSKSTNLIERMVEDMVQESMAKGDFDNLPGKGRPIPMKTQYCPFMDISQHNLNQVLVNNGVVPPFIAQDKEIRHRLADVKSKLFEERVKLGRAPLNSFNEKKWSGLLSDFSEDIGKINDKIAHHNLVVPLLPLQKISVNPSRELQKVLDRYQVYEKKMLDSSDSQGTCDSNGHNETVFLAFVNRLTQKLVDHIFYRYVERGSRKKQSPE